MLTATRFLFMANFAITSWYFLHISGAVVTDPSEVSALRAIRTYLIDPLDNLHTWSSGDPCTSKWMGIFCNTMPNDGYLHIQDLHLLKLNLSGSLAPELGLLSHLNILDFMWNKINGSIPKEIGNITSLRLLLLSGNELSGPLPEEIGYLSNLDRLQIDLNQISGPIPKSFANLNKAKHLHMNNNSISGHILPELFRLPSLLHLLLDNNNLTGLLPLEFSKFRSLKILQLDNNNFAGSSIPASYGNMSTLLKLSLRNCGLKGAIPDLSRMPQIGYIDLSWNQLQGNIPSNQLSINITTIDLSNNFLTGSIPSSFSRLPKLQRLSLENNHLDGAVPSFSWQDLALDGNNSIILDFQNNSLTNISGNLSPPENVTVLLHGNPICANSSLPATGNFCQSQVISPASGSPSDWKKNCYPCPTDLNYERNPLSPIPCVCAVPLGVGFRLKSPGISDFRPYVDSFELDVTSLLNLFLYQLYIESYIWEPGPRLRMHLKLFPSNTSLFDVSEVLRIRRMLTGWEITLSDIFGPYELLNFTLGSYTEASINSIKIDGVKGFAFEEMALATNNFSNSSQVGHGGYGKVYKGILADGTIVAIKRAQADSLQGSKEFFTEIELLSRLHHRNLVSLVGYCNEEDDQMLVYEFMPNGTLRDHLSAKLTQPLNFSMRLRIALDTAKGILYLHTEADPPIFHRDIKATNILLDSRFVAKVADFGLSRLAPIPDVEGITPGHVSTVVKGTPGYLDPEYFLTHQLTDKSDVYSLGVVFLELLTGMHPISHGKNIVREASIAYQSGRMFSIIDNSMGSYPSECIGRFVSLALRCCRDEMSSRPSMAEIVRELENLWHMILETDSTLSESTMTKSSKEESSSSTLNPYTSSDYSSTFSTAVSIVTPR